MKKIVLVSFCAGICLFADASFEQKCLDIAKLSIPNTQITAVKFSADGEVGADKMASFTGGSTKDQRLKPHCIVSGEIGARTGADGKHYGTGFEMRLPQEWNEKFLFQGGGGTDGFVAPAVGNIPVRSSTAAAALARGYAVVSMDGGHPTRSADFGADQQARLDFAYQSIGKVTAVAKFIIQNFYGNDAKHSYFMGCSNGGREAMMAAQRYPLEFDGIVAANAGFRLSRAAIAQQWDYQQFIKIAPKDKNGDKILANALTKEDLDLVSKAILDRCDGLDGLKDGIINAWEKCDFDPSGLKISKTKIAALKAVFDGAKNSKGEQIYSRWYYDAGINQPDWRRWKLGDSQSAQPNARSVSLGADSLKMYFMTPANANFDLENFDFDRDTPKTYQTGAINDAVMTDLSSFKARGGKMILVTGVSDPVFSAKDQVEWFKELKSDTAGADEFARLFLAPGMTHCGGGNGLDDFDPLSALERWHDEGVAPESLLAKGKAHPNKQMPLCAYPKIAVYIGGDENSAASFECR